MPEVDRRRLEQQLTEAMFDLYQDVGEATGYWANYFLRDLKKIGGLALAHKLLSTPSTSEGFERLKKERMLNRSLEALVLGSEFRPLFSEQELKLARQKLDDNGYSPSELRSETTDAPKSRGLTELLLRVESETDQMARWELRNEVVAYGADALEAMRRWLAEEHLPPFALSVLEKLAATNAAAGRAIDVYATFGGKEAVLARAALARLRSASRTRRDA